MSDFDIDQEIAWCQEEIEQDEAIEGSSSFSDFHRQRLTENRERLVGLEEVKALGGTQ